MRPFQFLSIAILANVIMVTSQSTNANPDQPAVKPAWKELFTLKHDAPIAAVAVDDTMIAVAVAGVPLKLWNPECSATTRFPL